MAGPKNELADMLKKTGNVTLPALDPESEKEDARSSSREGKKVIQGHFDKEVHLKMKILAAQKDTKIQNLLEEAIEDLLEKYEDSFQ